MSIALAAYSCRDSLGMGGIAPASPCSLLSPLRDTDAIMPSHAKAWPDAVAISAGSFRIKHHAFHDGHDTRKPSSLVAGAAPSVVTSFLFFACLGCELVELDQRVVEPSFRLGEALEADPLDKDLLGRRLLREQ